MAAGEIDPLPELAIAPRLATRRHRSWPDFSAIGSSGKNCNPYETSVAWLDRVIMHGGKNTGWRGGSKCEARAQIARR